MRPRYALLLTALVLLTAAPATHAALRTEAVEYRAGDTVLQGYLAWDDARTRPRPGVLVVHEWWGHNAHARAQAERLARAGYVAFALDMFGKGRVTQHPEEAQQFVGEALASAEVAASRFAAARARLAAHPLVDTTRVAAIGYCFGGAVVLGQARAGANLDAVVSFHGALATASPARPGTVRARVLVCTGAADEFVPEAQVQAFEAEMRAAGADFKVVRHPGAKHGFTNPKAAEYGLPQLAYDAKADAASWAEALKLLKKSLR
jgi:dienelactone hydrolase